MFVVALALLIVGVWAIGGTQTITMNGSVNFEIADKSLYVQDVRMQEDVNSAPYSLKEQGRFMPGFINGNFDMNLGDFTNSYGSFALYFDIINTMDETTSETFAYTVDQPTAPSGTTVDVSILGTDGTTLEQIPQGTVKPSEISNSTLVTATIKLTIASTSSSTVDLSGITITINQVVPEVYDYFTFEVNDDGKTVTLTDYNKNLSDSTDVVIPSTVSQNASGEWIEGNTYTVTAIANGTSSTGVFYNSGITSITFPSSLTSIGGSAFYRCSGLTGELNLGECTSLTSIGSNAFYRCSGLTGELNLGECTSLTSIGDYAFYRCSGLTGELNLGECTSLTSIGNYAFSGCSGLTGISLPSSLTSIGEAAFSGCSGLTSITVEGGNSVYHSEGNCVIETNTNILVVGCKTSVIPSYITSIGDYAFQNCSGLTGELNLGGCTSLTSIGGSAFDGCSGLTGELNLGGCTSLTSIGDRAFDGCSGLTGELDLSNCTSLTSIGNAAFFDCSKLTSISLPSSLTSIGNSAFYSCDGLTGELDLSNCTSLTSIGYMAFFDCGALKSVVFPEGSTGWYVTQDETATSGTPVSVTNSSTNARNLTDKYDNYYWKRNV